MVAYHQGRQYQNRLMIRFRGAAVSRIVLQVVPNGEKTMSRNSFADEFAGNSTTAELLDEELSELELGDGVGVLGSVDVLEVTGSPDFSAAMRA